METQKIIRTYSELIEIDNFIDRFRYLKIGGVVGEETFGSDRYLNQVLYTSNAWRDFRRDIIIRDNGCDLGVDGYEIGGLIIIHHLNPITKRQVLERDKCIFDPENVICVSDNTHKAIHYGSEYNLILPIPERKPNDTCLWGTIKFRRKPL